MCRGRADHFEWPRSYKRSWRLCTAVLHGDSHNPQPTNADEPQPTNTDEEFEHTKTNYTYNQSKRPSISSIYRPSTGRHRKSSLRVKSDSTNQHSNPARWMAKIIQVIMAVVHGSVKENNG